MKKILSAITILILTSMASLVWAGVPDNGLPSNGLPENGLSSNGVPNNGIPGNGEPKNIASKKVSHASTIGSATGGAGGGKTKFNEFNIKKSQDKSNAILSKKTSGSDEVHTDKHGRVKVKLNWDRKGTGTENKDNFGKVKSDSNHIGSDAFGGRSGGVSTHLSTHDKAQLTGQLNGDGKVPISGTNQVSKVKVRAYDPGPKKGIIGSGHPVASQLNGDGNAENSFQKGHDSRERAHQAFQKAHNQNKIAHENFQKAHSQTKAAEGLFQKASGLQKANGWRKAGIGDGSLLPAVQK